MVPVAYLRFEVGDSQLELLIYGLCFRYLCLMFVAEPGQVALELLNELLLVGELLANHFELLSALLQRRVVLCGHLELDVLLLERFDLLVKIVEFRLVLFNFLFVFVDPFFIFGGQLSLVLL